MIKPSYAQESLSTQDPNKNGWFTPWVVQSVLDGLDMAYPEA
eukprot:CAMPEP_0203930090 /NCGR_PEP_ID=MMETSP0359-20131031/68887_1 /ASSEMBLY_ACC=CAM_ASM_000338 /TAXON_ID=268821 /ORGANISM="Scrippsiella Hangoei, Strain SHTV-5" /LENGTH=41 /DNA_ID= /DNA_START= /DNA_END= /DNA_ORIENTATION=